MKLSALRKKQIDFYIAQLRLSWSSLLFCCLLLGYVATVIRGIYMADVHCEHSHTCKQGRGSAKVCSMSISNETFIAMCMLLSYTCWISVRKILAYWSHIFENFEKAPWNSVSNISCIGVSVRNRICAYISYRSIFVICFNYLTRNITLYCEIFALIISSFFVLNA